MILTRKLLAPTLVLFVLFLAGLFIYFFSSLHDVYHEAEEGDLASFSDSFSAELENQKRLVLSLALETAGDQSIQQAFAERDRRALLELVTPGFILLQANNANLVLFQFHLPDGKLFFNAAESGGPAADTPSTSPAVIQATAEQATIAGLEFGNGDLGIRGIAPIFYQGSYIGSVEFGTGLNNSLLADLKNKYGGEWQILLAKDLVSGAPLDSGSPNPNLMTLATTQATPLFNNPESYILALEGNPGITHPSVDGRDYAILTTPLYDYSGSIIGVLDIVYDHSHISATQNSRLLFAGLISLLAIIVGVLVMVFLTSRTLQPIRLLTRAAAEIAEGNVSSYVNMDADNDEIGVLVRAFNRMTAQLRGSIVDLEQRVAERTRDLENQTLRLRVAAEIARDTLSARNLGSLLDHSAQLIFDRFNLYHVGIFLVDKNREFATLTASPSEEGQSMISKMFKVAVGEPNSVGRVAATGEPRISSDNRQEITTTPTHLLPNTLSEITLPLKSEQKVLGVLDIQSEKPQAFKQNEIAVFQVLADQLATAIERTRLVEEVALTLEELERSYGRYTREGWRNLSASGRIRNAGYRFNNIRIEPVTELTDAAVQALGSGTIINSNGDSSGQEIAIPIKLRGQTIGAVHARLKEGSSEATMNTLQLAIDRLASALESARLYEQASLRADREQAISQITNAISSSSEYDLIMRTTVRELGNILNDTEVAIQIVTDNGDGIPPAGNGIRGQG
ncbi:MAG TPA: cache domain-containing protein [Anaerolineales bacterium]|nr:cache domain-containing protein [Anaerolineales bacterium]